MLRAAGISGDKRQIDIGLLNGGKLDFGFFRRFFQSLQGHSILPQVNTLVAFELIAKPINDSLVEIVTAEVSIAGGRFHLEGAAADIENGNIEGTAAQVINRDDFFFFLSNP